MSIRFKFLISNILMTVIPLIASIILAIILMGNSLNKIDNKTQDFDKVAEDLFKEFITISNDTLYSPDKFKDISYLEKIDNKLKKLNSGVSFTIDKKNYYTTKNFDEKRLPDIINNMVEEKKPVFRSRKKELEYFKHSFKLSEGQEGTLYILFDSSPIDSLLEDFFGNFIKYFILIILITNGILTIIVSQSIINPLKKLKSGVNEIKNGNLAFSIKENAKDEVGEVCRAFEEMRERLYKALKEQIRYDEERNEFLASITHDLKTPITSIKGHIEGIKEGIADTREKSDKYIDIIYKKTIDMDNLINDLTFYSNQTLNKIPYNFSKVKLKEFIEDMADEYDIELRGHSINIAVEYNIDIDTIVRADVEKLKRVVSNIFQNSVKHMDKKDGNIIIEVYKEGNKAVIGIHDNGEGISKEVLPNIFDRFYRGDTSRNTSKGGSGLGLAIARQIIQVHEGKMWAQSEVGKGTSIYFELDIINGIDT